jgi:hypothetical protein
MDPYLIPKTWVKVELSFAIAFGEVVYSRPNDLGSHRVGIRLEALIMREGLQGKNFELGEPPSLGQLTV